MTQRSPVITELINKLELEYPDKASVLTDKTEIEREKYLAQLELIAHIKLLTQPKDK